MAGPQRTRKRTGRRGTEVGAGWVLGLLNLARSWDFALEAVGKDPGVLCSAYDCCFGISRTVWKAGSGDRGAGCCFVWAGGGTSADG